MNTKRTLSLPMYNCKVYFMVTSELSNEVNKLYKKNKLPEMFVDEAEGVMVSFNIDSYYVIIEDKCLTYNTIAHEVHHLITRISEDRGIEDEEAEAWLSGHLSEEIYKFLDKKKIAVKHGN